MPPDFFYFDGVELCMEWLFGSKQDHTRWRILYVNSPREGVYLIEQRWEYQSFFRGIKATEALFKLLTEAKCVRPEE